MSKLCPSPPKLDAFPRQRASAASLGKTCTSQAEQKTLCLLCIPAQGFLQQHNLAMQMMALDLLNEPLGLNLNLLHSSASRDSFTKLYEARPWVLESKLGGLIAGLCSFSLLLGGFILTLTIGKASIVCTCATCFARVCKQKFLYC